MMKKIPIKIRLTMMIVGLLTICCVILTLVLNFSARQMVEKIDASEIIPVQEINNDNLYNVDEEINENQPIMMQQLTTAQAKTDFSNDSIIFMILIISLGGIVTYYISKKALEPLNKLNIEIKNTTINSLVKKLDIPDTNDEIAELTKSFNDMTQKLNDSFMTQQRFSANVAHELKTPLTIIKTKIEVFKKKSNQSNDEYKLLIENFEKQIKRLSQIINNLLDLTNISNEFENEKIQLKDLLEEIVSELSYVASKKNVELNLNCNNITIDGNIELLNRAFYNIIENAIKYNVNGGKVIISVEQNEKTTIVKVMDTGIGIPNELKNDIFKPFYCVDESRSREMGGAGLGLALVDNIIKRHKGKIIVTDNEKKGTCFTIFFKS